MNILSRYIATTYVKYWALCLLALVLMVVLAKLFGSLDEVFSSRARLLAFLDETVRALPAMLDILLPMTVLLATVFTFNALGRSSELVAMRAAGMGLARQLAPVFMVLIFIAGLDYFNQNYLFRYLETPGQREEAGTLTHQWRAEPGRIVYLARVDSSRRRLDDVRIFDLAEGTARLQALTRVAHIRRPGPERWLFEDVTRRRREPAGWTLQHEPRLAAPLQAFPDVFVEHTLDAHHMPLFDLSEIIRQLERQGQRVELYELEWYQKTAAVFAPFVLVWFGAPLAQTTFRSSRASGEIMAGILGGLLFLIATEIAYTLGKGGFVAPWLGAWSVNLGFLALGALLMWRAR